MSEKSRRSALKYAVRRRLLPHIRALGFESTKSRATRDRWTGRDPHDFPLGRRHDGRLDFVDVYWEKYGRPEFVIFFATCEDAETVERMDATWIGGTLVSGHHVLPWGLLGGGGTWFGPHQSADAAVDLAIERLDELDTFLRGPHPKASARIVQFGFNDYVPTLAGKWLHLALITFPVWLGRTWRALRGSRNRQLNGAGRH